MSEWQKVPRVASVPPYAAMYLVWKLAEKGVTKATIRDQALYIREHANPRLADQLEFGWMQLEATAMEYRERLAVQPRGPVVAAQGGGVSDDGSGKAETGGVGGGSVVEAELSTKEAAEMLGLKSERRVGQLLADGALQGRKVGRSWLVSRSSVEMLRDARSAS